MTSDANNVANVSYCLNQFLQLIQAHGHLDAQTLIDSAKITTEACALQQRFNNQERTYVLTSFQLINNLQGLKTRQARFTQH